MSVRPRMAFTGIRICWLNGSASISSAAAGIRGIVAIIVWLIIGAIAAGQRHYYSSSDPNKQATLR